MHRPKSHCSHTLSELGAAPGLATFDRQLTAIPCMFALLLAACGGEPWNPTLKARCPNYTDAYIALMGTQSVACGSCLPWEFRDDYTPATVSILPGSSHSRKEDI
jgi:hypothetical protein